MRQGFDTTRVVSQCIEEVTTMSASEKHSSSELEAQVRYLESEVTELRRPHGSSTAPVSMSTMLMRENAR